MTHTGNSTHTHLALIPDSDPGRPNEGCHWLILASSTVAAAIGPRLCETSQESLWLLSPDSVPSAPVAAASIPTAPKFLPEADSWLSPLASCLWQPEPAVPAAVAAEVHSYPG